MCKGCFDAVTRGQDLCLRCNLVAWAIMQRPPTLNLAPIRRMQCGECNSEIRTATPIRGYCVDCCQSIEVQSRASSVESDIYHRVRRVTENPDYRDRLLYHRPPESIQNGKRWPCGFCNDVARWMFACECRRIVCEPCWSESYKLCLWCRRQHSHTCHGCAIEYGCHCTERHDERLCPRCDSIRGCGL